MSTSWRTTGNMLALTFLNYVCLATQLNGFYKTTEWEASFPCRLFPLPVLDHSYIVCKYRLDVVTSWHLKIRKGRLTSKKRRESSRNCFKPEKRTVSQPTVQDSRAYSKQDALNVVSLSPYHHHHVLLIAIDGSSGRWLSVLSWGRWQLVEELTIYSS